MKATNTRMWTASLFLGLTLSANFAQAAGPMCQDVFRGAIGREWLPANFDPDQAKLIEVTNLSPVLDQGSMGFCWLNGTTANLLNRAQQRTGVLPSVAIHYWSYYHFLFHAIEAVEKTNKKNIQEGGWMENAVELVRRYGVVSLETWEKLGGTTTMQLPENSMLEHPQLQMLLGRIHLEQITMKKWLEGKIADRNEKDEHIRLEKMLIEKSKGPNAWPAGEVASLRKILQSGQEPSSVLSPADIERIENRITADGRAAMTRFFNQMYFGQDGNPVEKSINVEEARAKARELFPEINDQVVTFMVTNDRHQAPRFQYNSGLHVVEISINDAARLTKALIESNVPVGFSYDHQGNFVDALDRQNPEMSGLMSVRRRAQWPISTYVDRRDRTRPAIAYEPGFHFVNLIGAWINPKATPEQVSRGEDALSFRLQNSWGEVPGQKGFFAVDRDYFGAFGAGVSVFTKDLDKPSVQAILGPALVQKIKEHLANVQNGI